MKDIKNTGKSDLLQLVSFKLADEEYGIDILSVREINKIMDISKVPNAPDYIEGIVNLRGKIVPVVDLRKRLHFEIKKYDKNTRLIVIDILGKVIGFLVDEVYEVLRISNLLTEAPPPMTVSKNNDFIIAIGKLEDRLISILDLEKLFTLKDISELETAALVS